MCLLPNEVTMSVLELVNVWLRANPLSRCSTNITMGTAKVIR